MNPFKNIQNLYFIGIGGIGMSALAQYFVLNGKNVAGYDKTPGEITQLLKTKGVHLSFNDQVDEIPSAFLDHKTTLVIYTPAIPKTMEIFRYFEQRQFAMKKRAEVLGDLSREMPTLAVAGTHGKTTISAILTHLLKQGGYKITAFIGGICENYQSNFICDGREACVVEADEFDRSFLQLSPQYAAITSMDADHLDIYGQAEELVVSFHQFADLLPSSDNLFYQKGLSLKGHTVAIQDSDADYVVHNVKVENGRYVFDLKTPKTELKNLQLTLPGKHNLLNAGIALALALKFGADKIKLQRALKSFKGVKRRFTYHLRTDKHVLIEDYAHHPKEIKSVHQAVREMHPGKKITAIFQPHLYSRTRDFAAEFAKSLSTFDEIMLLPIYPAREMPIPGIDSHYLLGLIDHPKKMLIAKEELTKAVKNSDSEVFMLLGAGDIGNEVEQVKKALRDEN